MIIREAAEHDIPALLDMGRRFFEVSGYASLTRYDSQSMEGTLRGLICDRNGILLVADTGNEIAGMAGGLIYPFYFAHSHRTGQELFWWVDPDNHGGGLGPRLLERMEQTAKEKGARSFVMGALAAQRPEQTGALYRRRGYAPTEHLYIREL